MAETVGTLLLDAVGLATLGAETIIGTLTVASVVGGAVLLAGSIGLQLLLAKRPSAAGDLAATSLPGPENGHAPLKQAILPRIRGFGRNRLAGGYVLYESKDGVSYDVCPFHHGRIGGIVGYYLQDDVIEIDGSGVVQEQGDGRYAGGVITIETRLGEPTETAYESMVAALPEIWTDAHRGDGLASLALICTGVSIEDYTTVYPRGLPVPSIVADCAPLFDVRDPVQEITDESTWLVSANPVVEMIEFLTNADSGFGFARSELVDAAIDQLNAEADICDEAMVKNDGSTEPRYAAHGVFTLDSDPADAVAAILDSCDGWMGENGDGTLALKVGKYRAPAFTLESEHIRGFSLKYGVTDEEMVNEIAFTYTEPQGDYKTLPGQPWRDQAGIDALGKAQSQSFSLPWVQSHSQGRRLSKRKMAKLNPRLSGTLLTTFYGIQGMGERWIKVEAPDKNDDLADLVIEVLNLQIDFGKQLLQFDFIAVNPNEIDDFDAPTEEGTRPAIPDKLVAPPPPVPEDLVVTMAIGGFTMGFRALLDDPGRSDLTFQMGYRVQGSGTAFVLTARQAAGPNLSYGGFFPPPPAGRIAVTLTSTIPVSDRNDYEVQLRAYASSLPSAWSASAIVPNYFP